MDNHQAQIIDGRAVAQKTRDEVRTRVQVLRQKEITPKLGVILVGGHPPSQIYVKYKQKAADEVGVITEVNRFQDYVTLEMLYQCVDRMNEDPSIHGILVQLPLPPHLSQMEMWSVVERVSPDKDVDGLHPFNQGLIAHSNESIFRPSRGFVACTPLGCLKLLTDYLGDLSGFKTVVVGRSRIVGSPMAQLLTRANATVTLCHSRTRNLRQHLKTADIIIAAAGIPHLITADDVCEGAVVIDVGIHRLENGRLCGDVDFESVSQKVKALSPVPGGVGPMTIASLMNNVCLAAERTI
jgi:methylenetetrahydrofolate dehydrogenase (NADP+) / methenyltetrahydrofolate cyclohydrolase